MSADNRKQRRARERSEARKSRHVQKAVVALGAGIAIGVGTAGGAAAETIQAQTISQNSYATVENLIAIADNLGRTQIAMLAPAASVLPDGWVPVVTSTSSTNTEQLNFLEALTQGGQLVLAVPDTSHVPGASTALSGISPLVAQGLSAVPLAGTLGSGATVYGKMASAWGLLNVVNLNTGVQNGLADAAGVFGPNKVYHHAGQLSGIPDLDDAMGFWTGTRTTSNWTGTTSWLGATSTSWINQDQVSMDGVTSADLKALFASGLNTPVALVLKNGKCSGILCSKWVQNVDANGNLVYTTTYDPNVEVTKALSALDGIDVGGFTITQREAGGTYAGALGGKAGWLAAATQVVVPGVGGADDYVATVPVYAAGISLPNDLFTTGMQLSPGLVTTSGQSVDTVLGTRSSTWSIPGLGLGAQQTSLLQSSHVGPDGFAYNSGWTIATITLGDVTVPLVYSLGSVNVGPNGIGVTGPSFMGVGLQGFQLGSAPAGSGSSATPDGILQLLDDLPTTIVTLTPQLLFQLAQIEDPTGGVLSDPIGTLEKVLSPLFTQYVTPTATQVSQAIADAATAAVNQGSNQIAAASTKAAEVTGDIADSTTQQLASVAEAPAATAVVEATAATESSSGRHALPEAQAVAPTTGESSTTYVGRHRADEGGVTGGADTGEHTDGGSSTGTSGEGSNAGGSDTDGSTAGGSSGSGSGAEGSDGEGSSAEGSSAAGSEGGGSDTGGSSAGSTSGGGSASSTN
ncbi:hypothetical protein AAFP30_08430 [Gordonia sp. CPCC 205515]|uniref:hypothetical protein n=1 Tax=Gordonia sp. CPCC 205515 TaxID=3140791 RepID=UPI003AF36ED9